MADFTRDRPGVRPSLPPSAFVPPPEGPAAFRAGARRPLVNHEPSLDEMFTDPIFHLLLRRDRLTLYDVLGVIADARRRMRSS